MEGDAWARLARLETCCDVHISNRNGGSGERGWTVRVSTRGSKPDAFEVTAATVPEAVLQAVSEAERRRWPS